MNTPVVGKLPTGGPEPVLKKSPANRKWSFSFRYWRQLEHFGLGASKSSWFVSLLVRLQELSEKSIDSFLSSRVEKDSWRYHEINWSQTNIPLKISDLDWLDSKYLDNQDEFPIFQFQVSKSLGRVVGFWDESYTFNIILLDPCHNIQPAKSHNYRVDRTSILGCDYSSLLYEINSIMNSNLCVATCGFKGRLIAVPSLMPPANVILHYIGDEDKKRIDAALAGLGDKSDYTDLLLLAATGIS